MKRSVLTTAVCLSLFSANAQSYADSIAKHREAYKNEFITEERSPLKGDDTSFLRFFAPDIRYRVVAKIKLTPEAKSFDIPTQSGKKKSYRKYADLKFSINKKPYQLEMYQSIDLMKKEEYKDHLFVPFNDLTNYKETYAGGRYIDLSLKDIKNNTIILDFNKAYNPYCAFASGYNCPIPPAANNLKVAIKAGEKVYGKEVPEH
jgi:uncharacterized protein (DUF1684 family)